MVYRFVIISDEVADFRRDIRINSGASFEQFANEILKSVGYTTDLMTSFILCDNNWRKTGEVSMVDMGSNTEHDVYLMHKTALDDFLTEEKQKLMFTFDLLNNRSFYIELREITFGETLKTPEVVRSKGDGPQQVLEPEPIIEPTPHKHIHDHDHEHDHVDDDDDDEPQKRSTSDLLSMLVGGNDDYTQDINDDDEEDDDDLFDDEIAYEEAEDFLEQGLEIEDDLH